MRLFYSAYIIIKNLQLDLIRSGLISHKRHNFTGPRGSYEPFDRHNPAKRKKINSDGNGKNSSTSKLPPLT